MPLYVDPYTTDMTPISFAKVLVDVDISKELISYMVTHTPYGDKRATIKYEWVPIFYAHCQKIRHQTIKYSQGNAKDNVERVKMQKLMLMIIVQMLLLRCWVSLNVMRLLLLRLKVQLLRLKVELLLRLYLEAMLLWHLLM